MRAPVLTRLFGPRRRRILLAAIALVALLWVAFFDSHSLLTRHRIAQERDRLIEENTALRARIEQLEADLKRVDSDEVVERVAREQYGMRKDGETVHRVEQKKD